MKCHFIELLVALTVGLVASSAQAGQPTPSERASFENKTFDELTAAEKTAAKSVARTEKIDKIQICADPGNMPLSNKKREGFENKIVKVLGDKLGADITYFWRPSTESGFTRQTIDMRACDVLVGVPENFEGLLTTEPIYRSTYVLASRADRNIDIKDLDDPQLNKLRIGVFQSSGLRLALAKHGVVENVRVHIVSHDADLEPEQQPWRQVQEVIDGKLDVAGVWGPFAGFLKTMRGEPLRLQPVNLMEDDFPLEFDIALGVQPTNVVLKYVLDDALDRSQDEIKKILTDYGVPLVQCSRCVVGGDIPSHGPYASHSEEEAHKRFLKPLSSERTQIDKKQASADQIVTEKRVDEWLKDGADINQELSNAVLASDRERVGFLLERGADINKLNLQGLAPLHEAARQRDSDMLEFLLSKGADPNVRDADGWTPLFHATFRNHVPSVKALVKAGADIEATAPGGFTPLSIALAENQFYAADALLALGADVNSPAGAEKLTPLMIIASQPLAEGRNARLNQGPSSVDIGKTLIRSGADVNAKSTKGVTPLMVAASHNNPPLIGLLIQSGADVSAKTPDGKTALDIAKENQSEAAARQIELLSSAAPSKQGSLTETPKAQSIAGQ